MCIKSVVSLMRENTYFKMSEPVNGFKFCIYAFIILHTSTLHVFQILRPPQDKIIFGVSFHSEYFF